LTSLEALGYAALYAYAALGLGWLIARLRSRRG